MDMCFCVNMFIFQKTVITFCTCVCETVYIDLNNSMTNSIQLHFNLKNERNKPKRPLNKFKIWKSRFLKQNLYVLFLVQLCLTY